MSEAYRKKHQNRQSADWLVDADGKPLGLIGPEGKVYQPVIAETSPGGGIEKFTVSGIRRADGTVAPLIDTGDGWELLNGWHPRQLFEDGTPGEIFDNRLSSLYSDAAPPTPAVNGDPVMVRSGVISQGNIKKATNAILYSDQFENWNKSGVTVAVSGYEWLVTGSAGASKHINIAMNRTAGDHGTWAVEARLEADRWIFVGPGGVGVWFSLAGAGAAMAGSTAAYVGTVVPASRAGYVWCVVYMPGKQTSSVSSALRIYPATSAPTSTQPVDAANDGVGGVTITRAFYSYTKTGFSEDDYNRTHATMPEWVGFGSYCVQLTQGLRPVIQGRSLVFDSGKTMDAIFSTAPGVGSTVARARTDGTVEIHDGQTIGGSLEIAVSDIALVVLGRAVSGAEKANLRDWLQLQAAKE